MSDRTTGPTQSGLKSQNGVLARLPRKDLRRLWPDLEPVALWRGEVLLEAGEALRRAYFIETGVIALLVMFENGTTAVSAIVGREGMVGIGALLGSDAELARHLVQVTGSAQAMEACRFRTALRDIPRLRTACQSYTRALLAQILQTTACHSIHTVEQRCARSLLLIHDRSNGDTLAVRQEFLAAMLGVRRARAAAIIRRLERAGLICWREDGIQVLSRSGLEGAACECYAIERDRYQRLLPGAFDRCERPQSDETPGARRGS
jgi:CRP-like cAMP-binding protein